MTGINRLGAPAGQGVQPEENLGKREMQDPVAPPSIEVQATIEKTKRATKRAVEETSEASKEAKEVVKAPRLEESPIQTLIRQDKLSDLLRGELQKGIHVHDISFHKDLLAMGSYVSTLDLQGIAVTKEDLEELTKLCPKVKVLNVKDCGLHDEEILTLSAWKSTLSELNLSGKNLFTGKSVCTLMQFHVLKKVDFTQCEEVFTHCCDTIEWLQHIPPAPAYEFFKTLQVDKEKCFSFPNPKVDVGTSILASFLSNFLPYYFSRLVNSKLDKTIEESYKEWFQESFLLEDVIRGLDKTTYVHVTNLLMSPSLREKYSFLSSPKVITGEEIMELLDVLKGDPTNSISLSLLGKLQNVNFKLLQKLKKEERFSFDGMPLTKEKVDVLFTDLSKVWSLSLRNTELSDELLLYILQKCPHLKELYIDHNPELTDISLKGLLFGKLQQFSCAGTNPSQDLLNELFTKKSEALQKERALWKQAIEYIDTQTGDGEKLQARCDSVFQSALDELQRACANKSYEESFSTTQERVFSSVCNLLDSLHKEDEEYYDEFGDLINLSILRAYFSILLSENQGNISTARECTTPVLWAALYSAFATKDISFSLIGIDVTFTKMKEIVAQFPHFSSIFLSKCHLSVTDLLEILKAFPRTTLIGLCTCEIEGDFTKVEQFFCEKAEQLQRDKSGFTRMKEVARFVIARYVATDQPMNEKLLQVVGGVAKQGSLQLDGIPLGKYQDFGRILHQFQDTSLSLDNCELDDKALAVIASHWLPYFSPQYSRTFDVQNNPQVTAGALKPFYENRSIEKLFYEGIDEKSGLESILETTKEAFLTELVIWKKIIQDTEGISENRKQEILSTLQQEYEAALNETEEDQHPFERTLPERLELFQNGVVKKCFKEQKQILCKSYLIQVFHQYKDNIDKVVLGAELKNCSITALDLRGYDLRGKDIRRFATHLPSTQIDFSHAQLDCKVLKHYFECKTTPSCIAQNIRIEGSPQECAALIMKASEKGDPNKQILKALLLKADPKAQLEGGWTPLIKACDYRFEDIALDLINRGAPLDALKKGSRQTAFHFAAGYALSRVLIALFERSHEFDILAKDKEGKTGFNCFGSILEKSEIASALKKVFAGYPLLFGLSHRFTPPQLFEFVKSSSDADSFLQPSHDKKFEPLEIFFFLESRSLALDMSKKVPPKVFAENIQLLIKKYPRSNPIEFMADILADDELVQDLQFRQQIVEALFLTQNRSLIELFCAKIGITKIPLLQNAIRDVSQREGQKPGWTDFVSKATIVLPEHLKKEIGDSNIPPAPENVELDELLSIFDTLNFTDPSDPNYLDLSAIAAESGAKTAEEFRKLLMNKTIIKKDERSEEVEVGLIGYVKRKLAYRGTPREGSEALIAFYEPIERALKHIIAKLKSMPNTREAQSIKVKTMKELLRASPPTYCGGRIYTNAIKLYNEVVKGVPQTFEMQIFQTLADYRETLLMSLMNGQDVHEYTFWMRELGIELGIPSAAIFSKFDDLFLPKVILDKLPQFREMSQFTRLPASKRKQLLQPILDEMRQKFFERYTPNAIVTGWLKQQLETDAMLKPQFVDKCKEFMPKEFELQKFAAIQNFVREQKGSMSSLDLCGAIAEQFGINVAVRTLEEEARGACKEYARTSIKAIENEVIQLREENKTSDEIRVIFQAKYNLTVVGTGAFRLALGKALDAKLTALVEERYTQDYKGRIETWRSQSKSDKEIVVLLNTTEKLDLSDHALTIEDAVESERVRLYLRKEVVENMKDPEPKDTNSKEEPMRFKEDRVYDLCRSLGVVGNVL
ncbi:MAG: F-box/LRR-repeat protein 2 [Chlamydiia bacterium]|nr:F-box/LRR-repeat protein 2 [Chlamydiia bacterium]